MYSVIIMSLFALVIKKFLIKTKVKKKKSRSFTFDQYLWSRHDACFWKGIEESWEGQTVSDSLSLSSRW